MSHIRPEAFISILKKVLVRKSGHPMIQFFRYGIVSAIAFGVDFGTLYLLTLAGFFRQYYILAATPAFLLGLLTSYFLSVNWVFPKRRVGSARKEFLIFSVIGVVGLGLTLAVIAFLTEIVLARWIVISDRQIRIILSKLAAAVVGILWNFFARKYLLFR